MRMLGDRRAPEPANLILVIQARGTVHKRSLDRAQKAKVPEFPPKISIGQAIGATPYLIEGIPKIGMITHQCQIFITRNTAQGLDEARKLGPGNSLPFTFNRTRDPMAPKN